MTKVEKQKLLTTLTAILKIEAMAFTRDVWIKKASQRLEGALGEYAKLKFAKMVSYPDYWSIEVKSLMSQVEDLFDVKQTATKQKFDRCKAFDAAILDSLGSQEQITSARNEFLNYLRTPKEKEAFLKVSHEKKLKSKELLVEMILKYIPEDILKDLKWGK